MTTAATLMLLGRVVFGAFFLIAGVRNFLRFRERIEGATNYGWPLPASVVAVGFAVQVLGGLSLIFGLWTVAGALALIVFLVLATALYHNALSFPKGQRDLHIYLTLVNITLAGGLLLIVAEAL